MSSSRHWCFTINNPRYNELEVHPKERYIIWQLEVGKEGTPHLQGYIELNETQRLAAMRKWQPGGHFQIRRGTRDEARNYCLKEDDTKVKGPWERGVWDSGGHGARNDLLEIKRKIDEGVSEKDIADQHFGPWVRNYKAFREYKKICTPSRNFKTHVNVYWGETRTGKSKRCMEEAPNAYWKTRDEWWDGYETHADVIIDDFYGWLPFDFLLRLLDRYPLDVQVKGGFRRFVARTIWITSNKPPSEWYPNIVDIRPLLLRLETVVHYKGPLLTIME